MDPACAEPEVVVIENGRIAAVGAHALLDAYSGIILQELDGCTLLPGFIDAHNHLSIAALHPMWADVSAVADIPELQRALADQASREPRAPWVRGAWRGRTPARAMRCCGWVR